jgi:hypothetical protein
MSNDGFIPCANVSQSKRELKAIIKSSMQLFLHICNANALPISESNDKIISMYEDPHALFSGYELQFRGKVFPGEDYVGSQDYFHKVRAQLFLFCHEHSSGHRYANQSLAI